MRFLSPCSLVLQLLLIYSHLSMAQVQPFKMFNDDCDKKENRCLVHKECLLMPIGTDTLELVKDNRLIDKQLPCDVGVKITRVDGRLKPWNIHVGCKKDAKCGLRLKTSSVTAPIDLRIDVHDKTDGIQWDVQGFNVMMLKKPPINNIYKLEINSKTAASTIIDDLSLFRDQLTVCAYDQAGILPEQCAASFFFIDACSIDRLKKDCPNEAAGVCQDMTYNGQHLACLQSKTLIFNGEAKRDVIECTQEGWKKRGTDEFYLKHTSGSQIESPITVKCLPNCYDDPLLRKKKRNVHAVEVSGKPQLSCPEDDPNIGHRKILSINGQLTASTVECIELSGWKEIGGKQLVTFGANGAAITVECVKSCTAELIEDACGSRPGCEKPIMDDNTGIIKCADPAKGLHYKDDDKFIKSGIQCNKNTFTYMDKGSTTKTINRPDLKGKIAVACVPKCDDGHIEWVRGTSICPSGNKCVDDTKKDGKGNRMMQCRDPSSYIQVNGRRSMLPATCDPLVGWKFGSAPNEEIIQDFNSNIYEVKVTVDCIDACQNRVQAECSKKRDFCYNDNYNLVVDFDTSSKEYKCPDEYRMMAKGEEMIDEVLQCTLKGLNKKSDGSTVVLKFDPTDIVTTFKVECVSKCHPDFVTMTPVGQRKTPFTFSDGSYKNLECSNANEVLLINDGTRIFEPLNCDKDGWKDQSTNLIVPFSANSVKVKAECVKVCGVQDTCNDESFCQKMADPLPVAQPLQCGDTNGIYSLFFNGKETSGQVSCTNKGWIEKTPTPKTLVNYADIGVEIKDHTVKVECVRLCDISLMEDLCTAGRTDCVKIKPFSAVDGSVQCGSLITFALFVNGIETTDAVTCTKGGWFEQQQAKPLIDFTNDLSAHPQKVTVECMKVCDLSLIEDLCTSERLRDTKDCIQITYNDQTVKCESDGTYALYVNNKEQTGTVKCTRGGWTADGVEFLSFKSGALKSANPAQKVKVECRKLCGSHAFKDTCANPSSEKCKPTIVDEKVTAGSHAINSCPSSDRHSIFVNEKKTTGIVTCTRQGWLEGTSPILSFQDPTYSHPSSSVRVVCRELCDTSLIDDECTDGAPRCTKIGTLPRDNKVTCPRPDIQSLFVNGKETTGQVKCTTDGWTENDATPPFVDFANAGSVAPPNVRVHCKHKCHQDFVDDACQTDDESCSKATYNSETGVLSCADLPNEILVIKIDGTSHESKEGTATCKDDGWLIASASNAENPTKYKVHAKCLKVCHLSTLNDQTVDPFHKVNYTQLAVGGTLTCNAKDEMLEFDDKATYSDLRCTKEKGWLRTLSDMKTPLIDFAPMKDLPSIAKFVNVKCVKNLCTDRPFKPFCNEDAGNLCQEPDMTSTKYHMKCTSPLVIVRNYNPATPPIIHGDLVCRDGKWFEEKNAQVIFGDLSEDPVIDVKCIADKCTKCKENLKTIACSDQNCMSISFAAGKSSYCTSYKCASGNAFKFIDGNGVVTYQYNVNNEKAAIWCLGDNRFEYKSTDPSIVVEDPRAIKTNDQVGCVKQIPCTEVSPLNLECPSNVLCESDLIKKLQANEKTDKPANNENHVQCAADIPDKKYEMFYHDSGTKWRPASNLHCDPTGKWSAAIKKGERLDKIELPSKARIVCANKDPTEDQMIVISICDRCGPDAEEKVKQMKKGKCDGCSSDNGLFFNIEGDACVAKGSGGEIVYGDGETTNKIYCRKTTDGVEWKTNDGKVLAQFAGKESSTKIEYGLIGGITGAFLLIIIIGLAAFFYVKHDQKKKAAALEAAKSKGLTQKIDTIIDEVSVTDDVKTLVL